MTDVTKTLETLLAWSELHPDSGVRLSDGRVANGKDIQAAVFSLQGKIANQTRWLVESRQREDEAVDALKDMTESRDEWETIANEYKALRTPTPPRRLREYVSKVKQDHAIDTRTYRVRDGVVEVATERCGMNSWVPAVTVYCEDIEGVADLLANPEEPVETVYDVIQRFAREHGVTTITGMAMYEHRFREAVANENAQPQAFADAACTLVGCEVVPKGSKSLADAVKSATDTITQLRAKLDAAEQDAARLDWLEDNLAYLMLSARVGVRGTMESLHSRGKGWRSGELRFALDTARTAATAHSHTTDEDHPV